ncbi:MAG: phosphoribosylanthranilate isomerase [bacterium]
MSRTLIKICGVRDRATAECAVEAGAHFVGVVLVPSSPRFVAPEMAADLALDIVSAGAMPVAVLRHPFDDATRRALDAFPVLQFHGAEEPGDIAGLARGGSSWEIWKGLHFAPAAIKSWLASRVVTRLVVDGPVAGSGVTFDHSAFGALTEETRRRALLAGGLDPTNVGAAMRAARPAGVDVSSGVERTRGEKDHELIRRFVEAVREADAARASDA